MRLDVYLAENKLVVSRAKGKEMVENGCVTVNGKAIQKPSFPVEEGDTVQLLENPLQKYVGRGGLKLEAALDAFSLSPVGCIALDVGASSGGFTDCLLQRGAAEVYAVDSGTDQLHPKLREDARVHSMEGTNARYLTEGSFPATPTFAVMDVSFISQTLLFPMLSRVLAPGAVLVSLVKPQFEAGREALGKDGIVKSDVLRKKALERVLSAAEGCGFQVCGVMDSPILGGDGNREYLAYLKKSF